MVRRLTTPIPASGGATAVLPAPGAQASGAPQLAQGEAAAPQQVAGHGAAPQLAMPKRENMIDISQIEGQVRESAIRKVGDVVQAHPEEAMAILRTWLHQPV
jgi:flagellar M-ring protein FliF